MRFLHLADVHLDTSFAVRAEPVRRRLREASREALRRAVDLAIREEVHAIVIAGDLFDGERFSFQTERVLLEQANRAHDHGILWIYATGNHDPGSQGSRPLPWPRNVVFVGDAVPTRVAVEGRSGGTVGFITAIGHASAGEDRDLSRLLPRPEGDLPEVAVLHTQVRTSLGSDRHDPYAPSDLAYLRRAGYDYWALGHVHIPQELSADPPIWYSGCLQGRTHGDRGARGALLVDLTSREVPAVTFHPLAPIRWETLEVGELEEIGTSDALVRHIQVAWQRQRRQDPGRDGTDWIVRVALRGPTPLWAELRDPENQTHLIDELRASLGTLDVDLLADEIHPVLPLAECRSRTDVLGESLRLLEAVRTGARTLATLRASDLAGFAGGSEEELGGYVARLLTHAEGEVAARLLRSDGRDR